MRVWGGVQRCLPCSCSDSLSGKLSQRKEQISCPANSIRTLCEGKNKSSSSLRVQLGATRGMCCRQGTAVSQGLSHSRTVLEWRRKALHRSSEQLEEPMSLKVEERC